MRSRNCPPSAPTAAAPPPLPGVNCLPFPAPPTEVAAAREIARRLTATGITYGDAPPGMVPWLVGLRPFRLEPVLRQRMERLGRAVFAYLDAIQTLYAQGCPQVRRHLDLNMPVLLRGLDLEQQVVTFRLDVTVQDGWPRVTEVEEVYGNVGKLHAMQQAYGVDYDALFRHFAQLGLSYIFADDALPTYRIELELLAARLLRDYGLEVPIVPCSQFHRGLRGVGWRFCRTRDLAAYPRRLQQEIAHAACTFVNPRFHGYGVKAVLALLWEPETREALRTRLGSGTFRTLSRGVPWHRLLGADPPSEDWERLAGAHHTHLLKIVDCPERPEFTWGSRGVFFGDRSASRWREALEAAMHGRVPGVGVCRNVHYAACELIESDRFDVPFLHPAGDALALMPRARIRMTPIYFRHGHKVRMLAGHATFVNTSRKIHLGRHAVCVPLDWEPTPQAPGTHPETTPPGMAKPGARPREAGLA